jgi:Platelet-activating factor acetylhydrolase, isoform II
MKFTFVIVALLATGLLFLVQHTAARVEEISLGIDPRDNAKSEVKIDLYTCNTKRRKKLLPLIVFACGAGVPKDAYGSFAEGLAANGYVVAVIEHLIKLSPAPAAPALNFGNALDMSNVIAYTETQVKAGRLKVDLTQIILMGHSFGSGTILNALNQVCGLPFCKDPNLPIPSGVTVPLHPGVILGSGFGGGLHDPATGFTNLTNVAGIPFGIVNGAGDSISFTTAAGENITQASFDRLNPTKIIATIENLDHFSISEVVTNTTRGDILSTLPREKQIAIVVNAMSFLVQKFVRNNHRNKFCKQLGQQGFAIVGCLEEYALKKT